METVSFNLSEVYGNNPSFLQKLRIDGQLYQLQDPGVAALATQVQNAINSLIGEVNTLNSNEEVVAASLNELEQTKQDVISDVTGARPSGQFVSRVTQTNGQISVEYSELPIVSLDNYDYTDTGSGPVTAVNQTDGVISVTHGNIASSSVNSSSSNYNNISTVADHLTALEDAISALSGVDTSLLKDIEDIIAELKGQDQESSERVWITLVDKLKGLTIDGQDKTVAEYVNAKDTALEQSIKNQINAQISPVTVNDKYYTTTYDSTTATLEMTLHTDTTTVNSISTFATAAPTSAPTSAGE